MTGSARDRAHTRSTQQPAPRTRGGAAFGSFPVITDARSGASKDLQTRQRRYTITMAFRTACFLAMIFVPGVFRWILFACAVLLPYVAVIFANQASQRRQGTPVGRGEPEDAPALTTGSERDRVIRGDIDEERTDDRSA